MVQTFLYRVFSNACSKITTYFNHSTNILNSFLSSGASAVDIIQKKLTILLSKWSFSLAKYEIVLLQRFISLLGWLSSLENCSGWLVGLYSFVFYQQFFSLHAINDFEYYNIMCVQLQNVPFLCCCCCCCYGVKINLNS